MDSRHRAMILAAAVISVAILSLGGGSFGSDATDPTQDYSEVSTGQDITSATDAPTKLIVGGTCVIEGGYWMTSDTGVLTACQENEGWNVHYDTSINTLTLKEANISGAVSEPTMSLSVGIFASNVFEAVALTIQLEGTNTVTSDGLGIWTYSTGGAVALTISGEGSLNASCSSSGIFVQSNSGDAALTIRDADVNASVTSAFGDGVEIRAGENSGATLTVDDGSLVAQGASDSGSSICFLFGSTYSSGETPAVTVSGSALVDAREGGIASNSSQDPSVTTGNGEGGGGIIFDGDQGTVYGNVTLQDDLTIEAGESLEIPEGAILAIPDGKTLTIEGDVTVEGTLNNSGTIQVESGGDLEDEVTGVQPVYPSTSQTPPSTGEGYTIDYENETITILDGYEVFTSQGTGTPIQSGSSISNYIDNGSTLYIRKAQTSTHDASDWTELKIPARPSAPEVIDNTVTDTRVTLQYDPDWEYSKDQIDWKSGEGANVSTGLNGATEYTYYVRVSHTDASFASWSSTVEVYTAYSTPNDGEGYSIDYVKETITIEDGYEVNTMQDFNGTTISTGSSLADYMGKALYIRHVATKGGAPASSAVTIDIGQRPVLQPDDVLVNIGTDGISFTRSDVSIQLEWLVDNQWVDSPVDGSGDFEVRIKAVDGESFASEPVKMTVSMITGAEATISDDTITVTGVGTDRTITIPEEYSDYNLVIAKNAIRELAEADSGIIIERKGGITVSYDSYAVSGMLEKASDDGVKLEASRSGEILKVSVLITVYDSSGEEAYTQEIHDFGGTATISFEYILPNWLTPETVAVFHVVNDVITEMMETWYEDNVLHFTVDHHSTYVIGEYIAPDPDPVYPPVWDDDDDYVPILPPSVTVNKDDGEDMAVAIVACAAVGVLAALMLMLVWTTRRR